MQDPKIKPKRMINIEADCVKTVNMYMQVKAESNDFIKKFPEWDMLPKSLDNELIIAIRERDAARTRLEIKRKEKKVFDRDIKEKWKDLDQKLKHLREEELRYEQFSSENESKCEILIRKTNEDNEETKRYEQQTVPMQQSILKLEEAAEGMQRSVDELKPFEDFLEKVVVESKEFKNIDDVIKRYENLTNIRKELAQKHEKKTADLKRLTTDVFRRSKEKSEEAEHVSVEMADVIESLGKLKDEMIKTDLAYRKIENVAKEKKIEGDLVAASVWNIYKQMCRRVKKSVPNKIPDIETQLAFIAEEYEQLTKVLNMAEKIKEKSNKREILRN
ncbi:coiled-coil domain-containing protein 42 homolog [Rhopalosiphum padi]|uniref:coiled-coil domain-containing protein 42 homolog n=1 Tax=Rhopalosiphum padi TaxID=40932 RepID=UPI00298DCF61|nr:coiled-coil domain-containing protein 42 homolog [Rhopalosiphum padi]